jgi:hypothetical protein
MISTTFQLYMRRKVVKIIGATSADRNVSDASDASGLSAIS